MQVPDDERPDDDAPMPDTKAQYDALMAMGRALQSQAGRMAQRERAIAGTPPRSFMRAFQAAGKTGRRGRKAQNRAVRIANRKGIRRG